MNYYFLIAGITLFAIVIVIYLYFSFTKYRKTPELGDGVSLFLSCNGISAGTKVGYLGLMAPPATIYSDDRIYILLGGLAVVWVSIQTILTTIAFSNNSRISDAS